MTQNIKASYAPSSEQARQIAALSVMPADARQDHIANLMDSRGPDFVADLLSHVIGMANSVAENCREWLEVELIITDQMHPHQVENINTPSMLGAALGAEKAAQVRQEGLCDGCALRLGSIANQCEPTQADADWTERGTRQKFLCHKEGLEGGAPKRPCPGWARWQALKQKDAAA